MKAPATTKGLHQLVYNYRENLIYLNCIYLVLNKKYICRKLANSETAVIVMTGQCCKETSW